MIRLLEPIFELGGLPIALRPNGINQKVQLFRRSVAETHSSF